MLASVCWRDYNIQDVRFQTNRFNFYVIEEKEGFDQQFIHYYASKKKKNYASPGKGFKIRRLLHLTIYVYAKVEKPFCVTRLVF